MSRKILFIMAMMLVIPVASASNAPEEGITIIHNWAPLLPTNYGGEHIYDHPSLALKNVCIYSVNENGAIKTFLSGNVQKIKPKDNMSHILIIKKDGKEIVREQVIPNMPGDRNKWELENNLTESQIHIIHNYSCEIANKSGAITYARTYRSSAPMLNNSVPPEIEVVAIGTETVKYRNGLLGTWVPRQKIFVTIKNNGDGLFCGDIYMPFYITVASSQEAIRWTKKYEGILYPGEQRKITLGDTPEGNWRVSMEDLHARQYEV